METKCRGELFNSDSVALINLIAIVVHYLHFTALADDEAATPVAVILEVTSQEEGRISKESEIENKTSAIELSAETTGAGKPQESFATRIPLYLLITSGVTLRTAIWSKGNTLY